MYRRFCGAKEVLGQEPPQGVTFTCCVLQLKSRGSVRLRSADPNELPLVDPNYLDHENDLQVQLAGLRYAREVMTVRPMADTIKKGEHQKVWGTWLGRDIEGL